MLIFIPGAYQRDTKGSTRVIPSKTMAEGVGEGGLEPPRPYGHWHLKPARLPFRHSPEWRPKVSRHTHPKCRA